MIDQPTRAFLAPTMGPPSEGGLGMLWRDQKDVREQPVIVLPDRADESNITPAIALTILARSGHECRGAECGHCRSVQVLARALFPLGQAAA